MKVLFYRLALKLYKSLFFVNKLRETKNCFFLTFDDGPHPKGTPAVLDFLSKYNIRATFFMIGKRILEYPEIFEDVIREGHTIGNHSFSHLNGWKTPFKHYIEDVDKGASITGSIIFRPPYGAITPRQYLHLSKKYHIVLWTWDCVDYSTNLAKGVPSPPAILLFHEEFFHKTGEKILIKTIAAAKEKGIEFVPIDFLFKKDT